MISGFILILPSFQQDQLRAVPDRVILQAPGRMQQQVRVLHGEHLLPGGVEPPVAELHHPVGEDLRERPDIAVPGNEQVEPLPDGGDVETDQKLFHHRAPSQMIAASSGSADASPMTPQGISMG